MKVTKVNGWIVLNEGLRIPVNQDKKKIHEPALELSGRHTDNGKNLNTTDSKICKLTVKSAPKSYEMIMESFFIRE